VIGEASHLLDAVCWVRIALDQVFDIIIMKFVIENLGQEFGLRLLLNLLWTGTRK